MERRFKTFEAYQRALFKNPDDLRRFNISPGWAVSALGVTRQRVRAMIREGVFDSVCTDDGIVLLMRSEVALYLRLRERNTPREFMGIAKRWARAKRERQRESVALENRRAHSAAERDRTKAQRPEVTPGSLHSP